MSESPVAAACRRVMGDYDSAAERVCSEFCSHCWGGEKYPDCVRPPGGNWDEYDEPCALCLLVERLDTMADLLCGEGGALELLEREHRAWVADRVESAWRKGRKIAHGSCIVCVLLHRAAKELGATEEVQA